MIEQIINKFVCSWLNFPNQTTQFMALQHFDIVIDLMVQYAQGHRIFINYINIVHVFICFAKHTHIILKHFYFYYLLIECYNLSNLLLLAWRGLTLIIVGKYVLSLYIFLTQHSFCACLASDQQFAGTP